MAQLTSEPVPTAVPRAFRGLFAPEPEAPAPARPGRAIALSLPETVAFAAAPATPAPTPAGSIAWRGLLSQSVVSLLVQHSWRIAFEDGTREELVGPFFDDWFTSAGSLCCWDDGDKKTTNYFFHPMMGSAASFIFANNHSVSQDTPFGGNRRYWKAKGAQGIYFFRLQRELRAGAVVGSLDCQRRPEAWPDDLPRSARHAGDGPVDFGR